MCQATENCGEASAKFLCRRLVVPGPDRKSTRLNSSHDQISYAVFCLKKKKRTDALLRNPTTFLQDSGLARTSYNNTQPIRNQKDGATQYCTTLIHNPHSGTAQREQA